MKRGGLGRGLDALLPQTEELLQTIVRDIPIDDIDPNRAQPRKAFDEGALNSLAESIRQSGILSPLLVVENGLRFRIVAGERRFRAARLAGLQSVPCIVKDLTDEQQMAAALVENLQREDLNPIEEANAIQSLMKDCRYTQEQAASRLGRSRSAIANSLRLLKLPEEVRQFITAGELSSGHAKVLAGVEDEARLKELARYAVNSGCSVRQLEELAAQNKRTVPERKRAARGLSPELETLRSQTREALGLKVTVSGNVGKGKIILSYSSLEELESFNEIIAKLLN